jgi:hypothetical protein
MKTPEQLKAEILSRVDDGRSRLAAKREKRGNISDLSNLFQAGWSSGQRESRPNAPATRIASNQDKSMLKKRIIYPFRDNGIDVRSFAHWVTENWLAIGATYFPKTRKYPDAPAFRWLIACIDTYTTAYMQRDQVELGDPAALDRKELLAAAERGQRDSSAVQSIAAEAKSRIEQLEKENRELRASVRKKTLRRSGKAVKHIQLPDWED